MNPVFTVYPGELGTVHSINGKPFAVVAVRKLRRGWKVRLEKVQ